MLLSEPLASLITFFRTSLIKFYLNSQRMSDSFYHVAESSELDLKKGSKTYAFGHAMGFLRTMTSWCKHTIIAIYDVMKSSLTRVWDKKIRNGYIIWKTRVVMW